MLSRNVFSRWTIHLESWVRGKELTMRGNVYLDISYLAMPGSCLTQKGKRKERKKIGLSSRITEVLGFSGSQSPTVFLMLEDDKARDQPSSGRPWPPASAPP